MLNQLKTAVLLGVLAGIFLILGYLFGGISGLTVGFVLALVINFVSYWFSDRIVLAIYRAKIADKKKYGEIYNIVKDVSSSFNLPMPRVYIVPTETPNAFATGRNPQNAVIAFTDGIIRLLSKKELRGVISHEMAHINNRDILIASIAAVIASAISYIAMVARFGAMFGGGRDNEGAGNLLFVLVLSILAPIIAMIVQFAISRSREYLADSTGARTIKDPNSLADALQKLSAGVKACPMRGGNPATSHMFIVNPFSARGIINLFSTHPPMEQRVEKLRRMDIS